MAFFFFWAMTHLECFLFLHPVETLALIILDTLLSQLSRLVVSNSATPWTHMLGLPVHHQRLEFTQTHVYWVGDAIQLFFFSFIIFGWRLITLQYCSGFCHTLTWISHGVTCIPHSDPPPPTSSPPHPSGSSQCTRSERLSHASNLGWWSVSP